VIKICYKDIKNIHNGRRSRIKSKFLKYGIESFEPHEILELLLYYAIPRKDTNIIAHRLLEKFGSFSKVFEASEKSLLEIKDIGQQAVILIKIIPGITGKYLEDKYSMKGKIIDIKMAGEIFLPKFAEKNEENLALMLLDVKNKVLFCDIINKGSLNSVEICIKKIIELAVNYNSRYAVISHNHPNGNFLPSKSDLNITIELKEALKLVNVNLIDHVIVSDNNYFSFINNNLNDLFN